MDPITQGALGAACSQALLFNYDKKRAWIVGGLAGMAPDLDFLIRSSQDPMLALLYHRHFTHSFVFIPIGGLLVAMFLAIFSHFRKQWKWVLLASIIGYATHGCLDALTSYGTVLYWPFSLERVSFDLISIIDPFFTFPIILGLTWTIVFNTRKGVLYGLSFGLLFLSFNVFQHYRVIQSVNNYAYKREIKTSHVRAFPALASSTYWRVIFKTNHHFVLADVHTPINGISTIKKVASYPVFQSKQLPAYIKNSATLLRDYDIFNWFTDGYLIAVNKKPLHLIDGRYLIGKDQSIALWGVKFIKGNTFVKRTRFITLDPNNE